MLPRLAPGTTCLASAEGQQSHSVTDPPPSSSTNRNPAEIKNKPQIRAVEPIFTQAFLLKSFHLGHSHHRCHCRVHPASLLPCRPACASPKPAPHTRKPLIPCPSPRGTPVLTVLQSAKGSISQRDILSQPVSPEHLLGPESGHGIARATAMGRRKSMAPGCLQLCSRRVLWLWQGEQMPHTSQCQACAGDPPCSPL